MLGASAGHRAQSGFAFCSPKLTFLQQLVEIVHSETKPEPVIRGKLAIEHERLDAAGYLRDHIFAIVEFQPGVVLLQKAYLCGSQVQINPSVKSVLPDKLIESKLGPSVL